MALPTHDATSIGVFGGDPVVGRALEHLLRSAGYAARFLNEASFDEAKENLDGLQLLLFAGGSDAGRREASMALLKGALGGTSLPILELASSPGAADSGSSGVLPWPCRVDEMRERIEGALLDGFRPQEKGA